MGPGGSSEELRPLCDNHSFCEACAFWLHRNAGATEGVFKATPSAPNERSHPLLLGLSNKTSSVTHPGISILPTYLVKVVCNDIIWATLLVAGRKSSEAHFSKVRFVCTKGTGETSELVEWRLRWMHGIDAMLSGIAGTI